MQRTTKHFLFTLVMLFSVLFGQVTSVAETAFKPASENTFVSPSSGRQVRAFTPGAERWDPGHRGVDLAISPGQRVVAAGAGIVTFAGFLATREIVVIKHGAHHLVPAGEELFTVYEPVKPLVRVGDVVSAGTPIGVVNTRHAHCPSLCVHWGAKWSHGHSVGYLNPWLLLPQLPVSLLPWVS